MVSGRRIRKAAVDLLATATGVYPEVPGGVARATRRYELGKTAVTTVRATVGGIEVTGLQGAR